MRRFLFNAGTIGVVTAVFPIIGMVRRTRQGPRDWKLYLSWAAWGIGVAIAVGTLVDQAREARELAELDD